ncbi:MAG TPA: hypothetical protein VJ001_15710 [Rhodocyclaceae bacterium]|nr:hypothetical protein [Rhodocyclaceae bacterium]
MVAGNSAAVTDFSPPPLRENEIPDYAMISQGRRKACDLDLGENGRGGVTTGSVSWSDLKVMSLEFLWYLMMGVYQVMRTQ